MDYFSFIAKFGNSQPFPGCHEHHIVPRFAGGKDSQENLIYLTPRQHLDAHHKLLCLYKEGGIFWCKAVFSLHILRFSSGILLYDSEYAEITELYKRALSHFRKLLPFKHSEETRKLLSKLSTGNQNCVGRILRQETKDLLSTKAKGNSNAVGSVRSKEARERIAKAKSSSNLGRRWWNNGVINKFQKNV